MCRAGHIGNGWRRTTVNGKRETVSGEEGAVNGKQGAVSGYGKPHCRLDAWSEAMRLVKLVYEATLNSPPEERLGLSQQMRRAAVSVPSNIAEGAARGGKREFANFVSIARGSLSELHTQCLIAVDLGYFPQDHAALASLERVSKLLTGLYHTLTSSAAHGRKKKFGDSQ